MPRRPCLICEDPAARRVNDALASGAMTVAAVASRFRFAVADVRAHAEKCQNVRAFDHEDAGPLATTETLTAHMVETLSETAELRRNTTYPHVAIRAATAEISAAELLWRMIGGDRPPADAADMSQMVGSPAWRQMAEAVEEALADHPQARAALAAAIAERARGGASPPPQPKELPAGVRQRQW